MVEIVGSAQRALRDCGAQRHVKETGEREESGRAKPLSPSRLFYIFPNRRSGATGLECVPCAFVSVKFFIDVRFKMIDSTNNPALAGGRSCFAIARGRLAPAFILEAILSRRTQSFRLLGFCRK